MKTMQDYELRCTAEKTRRAYALGVPIEVNTCANYNKNIGDTYNGKLVIEINKEMGIPILTMLTIPTTQQMMGWLREQGVNAYVGFDGIGVYSPICFVGNSLYQADIAPDKLYTSYEQAELAAIDVALDYLEKGGTK